MLGIVVTLFTAHSSRGSSSSAAAAADLGITSTNNLKEADWSTEFMFRSFITILVMILLTAKLCSLAGVITPNHCMQVQLFFMFV